MHNPEPPLPLENEMHKILLDFEIQTNPLILDGRPNLVIVNKRKIRKRKEKEKREPAE